MINIEETSRTLNFWTISISIGVSIESDIQHSFCEMKDLMSWF